MKPSTRAFPASDAAASKMLFAGVGLLAIAAAALLGAPTSTAQTPSAAADDRVTFTVGITNEVDSFNPFNGIEAESYEMWALMYDYMITYSDKNMEPEPGLAESWDTSADGLTWTFHIRTGVKWSDGVDLTAKDIAYTYNRILDGGPEAPSWRSYLASVETITAPDDETVLLELSEPNAVLPLLPMPIVPEHIWTDVSEDEVKTFANEPPDVVGSGAFRAVEGEAGGSIYRFEPNPDYWQGVSQIDNLVFRVYKAEDPLVQALKAGEIDFADGVSPLQVQALQGQPGITALLGDSPGFDEIAFNVGSRDPETEEPIGDPNPAVLDPAFRFALSFAIDRQAIVDRVYQGGAEPATTIIPSAYSQYQWQPEDPDAFSYDPDKAEQLLDEAGYTVGNDGFRTMPDGSPMGTLRLFARSDSETSIGTLEFFKEWLSDIHIDAQVTAIESSKLTNVILDAEFDIFEWGWYVEPDPDSILSYFTCGQRGGWSDSWYCDDEYDKLYADQHAELDPEARQEIVKEMQQMLYEDAPYLVTTYSQIGEAYRSDRFHGFTPQPNPGGILLFQYGIQNYLDLQVGPDTGESASDDATADGDAAAGGSTESSSATSNAAGSSGEGLSNTNNVLLGVVGGIAIFALGGLLGGWLGYRKATGNYRE